MGPRKLRKMSGDWGADAEELLLCPGVWDLSSWVGYVTRV